MIINSGFSSGGGRKSVTVYATLLATGWELETVSASGTQTMAQLPEPGFPMAYVQTVNVSGIASNSTAIVSLYPFATPEQFKAAASAQLIAADQGDGTITVRVGASYINNSGEDSGDPPSIDIPIQVTIL